jgi:5-methylcytosine-specific restriction endonuclease McrA
MRKAKTHIGKPCRKCQARERYNSDYSCVRCRADWQRNNRKIAAARTAKWLAKNKERFSLYLADWHQQNRERRAEAQRQRYRANPEKPRQWALDYKARKTLAGESHAPADIARIFKQQRGRCAYCRAKLLKFHRDHIHPVSRGGHNGSTNIQLLCGSCNHKKSNADPLVFARRQGMLL